MEEAVVNLAALVSSRFPTAVLIIPASAASLNLGPEWDIKRCMVRAIFGSFGIPVISPDMLSTNIVWHSGSLVEGYLKLSDENVQTVITMLSSAQRLANALRKPDRMGYPSRQCDSPGHHPFLRQCDDGGWVPCSVTLNRWQAFAALAGVDTRLFPRTGHSATAYSFLAHDPTITFNPTWTFRLSNGVRGLTPSGTPSSTSQRSCLKRSIESWSSSSTQR